MGNKREIRVIGMRRSGHHAIVFWVGNHIDGDALYINDVYPHQKAERQFTIPSKVVTSQSTGRSLEPCVINNVDLHVTRDFYAKPCSFSMLKKYTRDIQQDWDCLLLSFEEWHINDIDNNEFIERHDEWYGRSKQINNILVLRDPFNCLASVLKGGHYWPVPLKNVVDNFIDLWKNHAKEFIGQTKYLSNLTKINFNKWHIHGGYRMTIMERLNIKIDESSFQYIPEFSNGSSFTGYDKQGMASNLRLQDRWRSCQDLIEFKMLKQDKELIDMSYEIFHIDKAYQDLKKWIEC